MTTFGFFLPGRRPGIGDDIYLSDPIGDKWSQTTKLGDLIGGNYKNTGLLPYLFIISGLIMFVMLIAGGFEILTSIGNEEKFAGGVARIKNALVGFLLLFGVFWLAQIAQVIFKIQIL